MTDYIANSDNGIAIAKVENIDSQSIHASIQHVEHYHSCKSKLNEILSQITQEAMIDDNFRKIIESFNYYLRPTINNQKDLKTKLSEANREYEVSEAEELKTKFAMKLNKNALSESAQNMYVHILAKMKAAYEQKVRPLIIEKQPISVIDSKVYEILNELYNDMLGTVFEEDMLGIKGMLYYLTGTCHVAWRYDVSLSSNE